MNIRNNIVSPNSIKPKISVIVPVYNQELLIKKCLDSIINQTLKDIEIIIINDGSTDNSINIIYKYMKYDKRIILINQINQGLSVARNNGILHSNADYLAFIDSDDYIEKNMLFNMINHAEINNSDIVVCGFKRVTESKTIYINNIDNEETFENMLKGILNSTAWNRIYRKELFTKYKITYPPNLYHEDMATTFKLYFFANRITKISECYYNWYTRDDSISENFGIKHLVDLFKGFDITIEFLKNQKIYKKYENLLLYRYIVLIKLILTKISKLILIPKEIRQLYKLFFKNLKKSFLLSKKNLQVLLKNYPDLYYDVVFIMSSKKFYLKKNKYLKKILLDNFIFTNKKETILKNNFKENLELVLLKRKFLYNSEIEEFIKLDFSIKLNLLLKEIKKLTTQNKKFAIYGNGIIGNIIAKEIKENLIVIFDQNNHIQSEYSNVALPSEMKNYNFDTLIISVFGRENLIKKNLKEINFQILEIPIN